MEEEPVVTWCRTETLILGFCGSWGAQGVYRFWLGQSGEWEFCPPETKAWDYYHQMAFRQHKVEHCKFGEIVDEVPSLPAEFPPPAKYHVKDPSEKSLLDALPGGEPVRMVRRVLPGNRLFKKICAAPERRLPVYVVLHEDKYESAFGDGDFRYFESAHLDEEAAKAHIDRYYASKEWSELHIRKVYLTVSGWTLALDTEESDLSPFDHFTKRQIVGDLKHPKRRLDPWGEPYQGAGTANEVGTKRHE